MSFQDSQDKDQYHNSYPSGYYENSRSSYHTPKNSGYGNQSANTRFSTLEPTAQEFYPGNVANSQSGAIKKKSHRNPGRGGKGRYGTGRTFTGHRSDYNDYSNAYHGDDEYVNNSPRSYPKEGYRDNTQRNAESSYGYNDGHRSGYNTSSYTGNDEIYKPQNQSYRPQSQPNNYSSRRNDFENAQSLHNREFPEESSGDIHDSNGGKNYSSQNYRRQDRKKIYEKPGRNDCDEYYYSNDNKGRNNDSEYQNYDITSNGYENSHEEYKDFPEDTHSVGARNGVSNPNRAKSYNSTNYRRHDGQYYEKPMKHNYGKYNDGKQRSNDSRDQRYNKPGSSDSSKFYNRDTPLDIGLVEARSNVSNPNWAKNYNSQNYRRNDRNYHEKPAQEEYNYDDDRKKNNEKYDDGGSKTRNNYDKYNSHSNNESKNKKVDDNGSRSRDFNDYSETNKMKKSYDYRRTDVNKSYDNRYQKYDQDGQPFDWRKSNNASKSNKSANNYNKKMDAASQRERLEEMLNHRALECLVCCEKIKNSDRVWSCMLCYNILHLHCVASWAKSSKIGENWRCPACQNVCNEAPRKYKCYCGKTADPKPDPGTIPHGCGEMCLRKGRNCEHKCTLLCHPGPCPDCVIMVGKECGCGATKPVVKCSTDVEIVCEGPCGKLLECGLHNCKLTCHSGDCGLCDKMIIQECYCGKEGRKVPCHSKQQGRVQYECGDICGKMLACGNHKCQSLCHEGPCGTCVRDVKVVHSCPCGKNGLKEERTSCLDPIPCCDKLCGKPLKCGQPSSPHKCERYCHEGECPPCPLTTLVRCRCGHMDKEIPCQQLTTKADDARCEKKCTKKRLCGKHKCNQRCCIEIEHACPLPCNRQLSCGNHRCDRCCHSGRCPPCAEASFEELRCECGAAVVFPPVACGTRPPACSEECSRGRQCGHAANHACHVGGCPPCTVLCKRWCYGRHEQRSAIPCHQENFSCGLPCGRDLPCRRHKCPKPCHDGACPTPCKLPCPVTRPLCGHPCGRPCHEPPCPETSCRHTVQVTCACGLQKATKACVEVEGEFKNLQMSQIKDKMGVLSNNQSVDISDILNTPKRPTTLKILDCTEECKVLERNRRLAIGLQIRNPDLSQKLTPKYSDFMRQWAKKDPHFCQRVHDKLTDLVQLAKSSKQKSRAYSFESMNRDKRHLVHEYCEHFGVDSAAYDAEPNRNIVATALKDKSWLPSMSLLEFLQRENGQRKVPGPVSVLGKSAAGKQETVSLRLPGKVLRPSSPPVECFEPFP
ncbi:unnamed protein product [Phaedon cochleariae]|uniref:Protein shuttle craft n=1 Tax=Phaedon cochleariae TaxID=80249 RepID=A0A9P0DVZ7_PHACE|nr:unnamed protein product [Phaedon cochleariae]